MKFGGSFIQAYVIIVNFKYQSFEQVNNNLIIWCVIVNEIWRVTSITYNIKLITSNSSTIIFTSFSHFQNET
jgi:hypothetical protein